MQSQKVEIAEMIRFALLFCMAAMQAAEAVAPFELVVEQWETWKLEHGKEYERNYGDASGQMSKEESFRMKIWMENKAKIEKHNRHALQGRYSYRLAMNSWGDLLHHEFVATVNGYHGQAGNRTVGAKFLEPAHISALPENVDWREHGAVTPVKNQVSANVKAAVECSAWYIGPVRLLLELLHHGRTGGDASPRHRPPRLAVRAEPDRLQQEVRQPRLQRRPDGRGFSVHQG